MKRTLLLAFLVTSCSKPTHQPQWFEQHPDQAAATLNQCAARVERGTDCEAAAAGEELLRERRLRTLRKTF